MSITEFYKKTVSTQRLVATDNKKTFATNLTDLACAIHPANSKQVLSIGSAYFNLYKMYCASGTDILIGDRIVDGSDNYKVQLVADYDDVDSNDDHMEIVILKG
ncbi:MAG: hypothetical protein P1P85_04190 [Patescibacteria group bacterium]|nr:hypothetical protein [Patescibacteria group bacterium]